MPFAQQQGTVMNFEKTMRLAARYGGMENEVEELFVFTDPSEADQRGPVGESPRGSTGPKSYEHVSRSAGPTPQNQQNMMAQNLMGMDGGAGPGVGR